MISASSVPRVRRRPPAPLVTIDVDGRDHTFWPYTATSPSLNRPSDPINLLFLGESDPRCIRAALLALDGERGPHFPACLPFSCRWTDAMGGIHAAFSGETGWTGSAIQLQCGSYDSVRVHLRLFDMGGFTVGAVHMDVLIPGTPEHQVLSWSSAERLLTYDLQRSGLLRHGPTRTSEVTPVGFRDLPLAHVAHVDPRLLEFAGVDPSAESTATVPIPSDGRITVIRVSRRMALEPGVWTERLELPVDFSLLKPFCRDTAEDYVRIAGVLSLDHRVIQTGSGRLTTRFTLSGLVDVIPVLPDSAEPRGAPYRGHIRERHGGRMDERGTHTTSTRQHVELDRPREAQASERMLLAPGVPAEFTTTESC